MSRSKIFDKEAIGREYRAGQLSVREIAAHFGCSHTAIQKWAKKLGWKRDLAEDVRRAVASKTVARVAELDAEASDDEIIEAAATRGAEVIESHRADIKALRKHIAELNDELKTGKKTWVGQFQGQVITKDLFLTAAERSQAVANLAAAEHKLVALERQAFGLDDPDDTLERVVKVIYEEAKTGEEKDAE